MHKPSLLEDLIRQLLELRRDPIPGTLLTVADARVAARESAPNNLRQTCKCPKWMISGRLIYARPTAFCIGRKTIRWLPLVFPGTDLDRLLVPQL
jgi:hypothetical protein